MGRSGPAEQPAAAHAVQVGAYIADELTVLGDAAEQVLTMSCGPGVLGINSRSNGLLLAYRGQLTEARATGLAQVRESAERGQGGPADIGRCIVAMADLFGGDYAAAMSSAQTVIENDPAYTAEGALPELIEAAVRAGDYEAAATAHKTLSERALAAGTPWAARAPSIITSARCSASST
jgi:hypothetical protein